MTALTALIVFEFPCADPLVWMGIAVRVAVCGPHHHWNKTCGPFVARYHDQKTIHAFALDLDANAEVGVEFDVLLHKMNDDIMSAEALCSEVAQSKLDMLQVLFFGVPLCGASLCRSMTIVC